MPTALVTGAAKRVGKAIALRLAKEGYDLIIHYGKSKKEAEETAKYIREKILRPAYTFSADLTNLKEIDKLVAYSLECSHTKTIDVLVNNAATFYRNPLHDLTDAKKFDKAWRESMDSNAKGPMYLARKIGYHMKTNQKEGGVIVNIGDHAQAFDRYYPRYSLYNASKGALVTDTKSLALELAPEVRVNMIANGPIEAPPDMTEKEKKEVAGKNLLQKWGGAESTAECVMFCIRNDFLTGAVIPNNGGAHLRY